MAIPGPFGTKVLEITGSVKYAMSERASMQSFFNGSFTITRIGNSYSVFVRVENRAGKTFKLSGQIRSLHKRDLQLNIVLQDSILRIKDANEKQLEYCFKVLEQIKVGEHPDKDVQRLYDKENVCQMNVTSSPQQNNNQTKKRDEEMHSPSRSRYRNSPIKLPSLPSQNRFRYIATSTPKTSPLQEKKSSALASPKRTSTPKKVAKSFYGDSANASSLPLRTNVKTRLMPIPTPIPRPPVRNLSINEITFKSRNKPPSNSNSQVLKGFSNLGNTCYMNAILQSLLGLLPFAQDLSNKTLLNQVHPACLYRCLHSLWLNKKLKDDYEVRKSLKKVKSAISEAATRFCGYSQHDAHEFLCQVLDQLKDDVSKPFTDQNTQQMIQKEDEMSPVLRNFECSVVHKITCKQCEVSITKEETHHDFSLDIPNSDDWDFTTLSVQNLLLSFFQTNELEYTCAKCGGDQAIVYHHFTKLPRILVLHLKRYRYDYKEGREDKIEDKIQMNRRIFVDKLCSDDVSSPLSLDDNKETKVLIKPLSDVKQQNTTANPTNPLVSYKIPKINGQSFNKENELPNYSPKRQQMITTHSNSSPNVDKMTEEEQIAWAMRESTLQMSTESMKSLSSSGDSGFGDSLTPVKSTPSKVFKVAKILSDDFSEIDEVLNDGTDEELMEVDIPDEDTKNPIDSDSGNSSSGFISRESFTLNNLYSGETVLLSDDSEHEHVTSKHRDSIPTFSVRGKREFSTLNETTTGLSNTSTSKKKSWLHEFSSDSSDVENTSGKETFLRRSAQKRASNSSASLSKRHCSDASKGLFQSSDRTNDAMEGVYPLDTVHGDNITFEDQIDMAIAASLNETKIPLEEDEDKEMKEALELSMKDCNQNLDDLEKKKQPFSMPSNTKEHTKTEIENYRLVSVVSHIGSSSNSGHYVSDVYDCTNHQWTRYDDSYVKKIEEHEACYQRQESGYILFYMYNDCINHLKQKEIKPLTKV